MKYLKIIAKIIAVSALAAWCLSSSGAMQLAPHQTPRRSAAARHVAAKPHLARPRPPRAHVSGERPTARRLGAGHALLSKPAKAAPVAVSIPAAAHPVVLPELTHGRDPFAALIRANDPSAAHANLPPGIAGLQVATIQLQGMVKAADGMVAVVANPQDRVYFLHTGDHIYDGVVEKIALNEITFQQQSKDAFGRTVDRDVSKRLYPTAGDAQ